MGANTFQIFSSSPRQWKASAPSAPGIAQFQRVREKHDLTPLVIHDNYLINLASANEGVRKQSIEAFRGELVRGIAIPAARSERYTPSEFSANQPIVFRCGWSTEAYCCTPFST